jgi:hypothetical protein
MAHTVDPQAQKKLNFANSFAFENFELIPDPYVIRIFDHRLTAEFFGAAARPGSRAFYPVRILCQI